MRLVRRALAGAAASLALGALFTGVVLGAEPIAQAEADAIITIGLGADRDQDRDVALDGILNVDVDLMNDIAVDADLNVGLDSAANAPALVATDGSLAANVAVSAGDAGSEADTAASADVNIRLGRPSLAGAGRNAGVLVNIDLDTTRAEAAVDASGRLVVSLGGEADAAAEIALGVGNRTDVAADVAAGLGLGTGAETDVTADVAAALALGTANRIDVTADVAAEIALGAGPGADTGADVAAALDRAAAGGTGAGTDVADDTAAGLGLDSGIIDIGAVLAGGFRAPPSAMPSGPGGGGGPSGGGGVAVHAAVSVPSIGSLPDTAVGAATEVAFWGVLLAVLAGLMAPVRRLSSQRRP